jgi:hypothetical protein
LITKNSKDKNRKTTRVMMKVNVATVLHGAFSVDVPDSTNIKSLKERIKQQEGYDVALQSLVLGGKRVSDNETVKSNRNYVLLMQLNERKDQYLTQEQIQYVQRMKQERDVKQQQEIEKQRQVETQRVQQHQSELQRQRQLADAQEQLRRQAEQLRLPTIDELQVDQNLITPLLEMGFPQNQCKKALLINRMNVNAAAEWLFNNAYNPNIDTPLTRQQMVLVLQANPQFHHYLQNAQQPQQQQQ